MKKRKSEYKKATDAWITPIRKGYKAACCDCGLVHVINFRIRKWGRKGNVIQFQVFRDERATGQKRRWLLAEK